NHLLVSDHSNGDIVIYDINDPNFSELGRIQTGAPGIMGIAVGFDGKLWYVNASTNSLVRIDPDQNVNVGSIPVASAIQIYPNPASTTLFLGNAGVMDANTPVRLMDATGRMVLSTTIGLARTGIDVARLAPGTYAAVIGQRTAKRVIIAR
ncbi:MAG TPA: T9SS type A sorting domain-containing protein, partial [Flavobacteriales bacterium]|nr:T9SS type A sorting domain-containing protein [Flavobacteriales bacterium]